MVPEGAAPEIPAPLARSPSTSQVGGSHHCRKSRPPLVPGTPAPLDWRRYRRRTEPLAALRAPLGRGEANQAPEGCQRILVERPESRDGPVQAGIRSATTAGRLRQACSQSDRQGHEGPEHDVAEHPLPRSNRRPKWSSSATTSEIV